MALWLGVFGQERAAADPGPVDLAVVVISVPSEATTLASGSVISYLVMVGSDDSTSATGDIPLEIDLENATFVSGTLQVIGGINCVTSAASIDCDIPNFTAAGEKGVGFEARVSAAGPVLVGAAIDPIDGGLTGEIDEGAAGADDSDDGDDPELTCGTVGEGTDAAPVEEPDNFDCTSHAVANADLTITKTASPSEATAVAVGSVITYTLTASNDVGAAGIATDVVIRDYIGTGLNFESAAPGWGVICGDTTAPQINCTAASIAPGESRTVVIVVTVSAASGAVLNGARVDPNDVIGEDNEDADDPALACAAVGEGAAGAAEPDNYDCTKHDVVEEATPTPSPTPTVTRDFDLQLGWNNFVWTGADATAADTALNCIAGNFAIAYALDAGGWLRYVPGQPDITTLATVDKYDSLLVLVTASEVQCLGMPVEP
jgi:uncharacterized repeat protein (TIGR01451 family)